MAVIMTRMQAAEQGLKRYWTGRPCGKGHDAPRFTSTGACVKCAAGYTKQYSKRLQNTSNSNLAGAFSYPLHPDDHAAAFAYCQALDLQRGRVPKAPPATVVLADHTPEDIERFRELALGKAANLAPDPPPAYVPKEFQE